MRARLLLLTVLALAPGFGLAAYQHLEERRAATASVEEDVLRLARRSSRDQTRLIDGSHQLLATVARLPEVRRADSAECSTFFASLLEQDGLYANLGVAALDGNIVCSGLLFSGQVNAADRSWFRRALERRDFAVGDYQVGRITNKQHSTWPNLFLTIRSRYRASSSQRWT